jgi:hypothetical protein
MLKTMASMKFSLNINQSFGDFLYKSWGTQKKTSESLDHKIVLKPMRTWGNLHFFGKLHGPVCLTTSGSFPLPGFRSESSAETMTWKSSAEHGPHGLFLPFHGKYDLMMVNTG